MFCTETEGTYPIHVSVTEIHNKHVLSKIQQESTFGCVSRAQPWRRNATHGGHIPRASIPGEKFVEIRVHRRVLQHRLQRGNRVVRLELWTRGRLRTLEVLLCQFTA